MKCELLLFCLVARFFLAASNGMHNHDGHLHQKLVDGENLEYKKFLNGLTDSQVALRG